MNRGKPEWDVPTSVESSNIHDNFSQLWSKLIICCTITITIVIEANSTVAPSCNPNWSGIIQYTWQLLTIVIQGLTICSNVQFIYADHISSVSKDSLLEKPAGKWLLLIIGYWEHPMPRTIQKNAPQCDVENALVKWMDTQCREQYNTTQEKNAPQWLWCIFFNVLSEKASV